jgi:hypothetical protein
MPCNAPRNSDRSGAYVRFLIVAAGVLLLAANVCAWFAAANANAAEPISVLHRGTFLLPTMATDPHGKSFTIEGLSGVTYRGGSSFTAVMNNSNKLVHFDVGFAVDGSIASATVASGLTLSQARDYEAIAYSNARFGTVWLADETGPRLDEFDLATGQLMRSVEAPGPFDRRRSNFGWESLTRRAGGSELWTANEEALTVDGGRSSTTEGTTVRLVRFGAADEGFVPAEQYAYPVDRWHAEDSPLTSAERSGLVELVQLPDGTLLGLERSLAFASPLAPSFENRLYQIDFGGATNVAAMPGLVGQSFMPVTKRLVWSGVAAGALGMNLEGLTVGPRLANGNLTLVGVVDDGGTSDPLSVNALVAFEITSPVADPAELGDVNLDGHVDRADIAFFASSYGTSSGARWEDADFDGDGRVTLEDLALLARNLPSDPAIAATIGDAAKEPADGIATPEPSTIAIVLGAIGALFFGRWAWKRRSRTVA